MKSSKKATRFVSTKTPGVAAFAVFVLFLFPASAQSQHISPDLQKMANHLERTISENHPEWKLQRIEPVLKTENVIIDQWSFGNSSVRVSLVPFRNANDAKDAIEDFRKYMKCNEEVLNLGDGGCWFGGDQTELAFRRGRITVYISSAVEMNLDPYIDTVMDPKDSSTQRRKLSKEMAQHAAKAIDSP